VLSQKQFRLADLVLAQRVRRRHEPRVLGRCLDMLRVGRVRALRVALQNEQIADFSPGVRHVRLERDRAAQSRERIAAPIERAQGHSHLVMRGSPVGLCGDQRLQRLQRGGRITCRPTSHAQEQTCRRMPRYYFEDFVRLLRC
jgi:hypothetical protein